MKTEPNLIELLLVVFPMLFLLAGFHVIDYLHDRKQKESLGSKSNLKSN